MTDTAGIPEKRIAANLITGFLGAGKTSALLSLLPHRPRHERWAILVNEYGMVSLDHILLDESNQNAESGVDVDELAGGCFCCSLSMALPFALSRLIRRTKPHRIFLEPTGSGHPAAVIDLLRTGRFAEMLDLRTTICLVDPRDYLNPRITNSTVFQDQIQMADVVAINFTDKCDPEQIRRCREFVLAQDPPKLAVAETTHGKLNPEWLDMSGIVIRPPLFANSHHSPLDHPTAPVSVDLSPPLVAGPVSNDLQTLPLTELSAPQVLEQREPLPSRPLRLENQGLEQFACGWIFLRTTFSSENLCKNYSKVYSPFCVSKACFTVRTTGGPFSDAVQICKCSGRRIAVTAEWKSSRTHRGFRGTTWKASCWPVCGHETANGIQRAGSFQ